MAVSLRSGQPRTVKLQLLCFTMPTRVTMRRFCSILLVVSSLWPALAPGATRPHYGGSLRVAAKETPASLDPASLAVSGPIGLSRLVFETLVTLDDRGQTQPGLATSWQAE